jgi:tRNA-dihydrouridine synthase C
VRTAVPARISVSAKLRLGWDDPRAIYENAARAVRGGADWLTIHGRTRMQGYTPPAFWEPIGRVREQLNVPVIANGEIWSVEDLRRCQEQSGAVHFMLGRGVLAEPGLARQCAEWLGLQTAEVRATPAPSAAVAPSKVPYTAPCGSDPEQWRRLLERLVQHASEQPTHTSARQLLARCKQWLNYAHKRGNAPWFDLVKRTGSVEELFGVLGAGALCGVQGGAPAA